MSEIIIKMNCYLDSETRKVMERHELNKAISELQTECEGLRKQVNHLIRCAGNDNKEMLETIKERKAKGKQA